jgi:hypothetical protein
LVLSGAGFFWTTFFWAGLTAWGLPGIGFLATGLVGMAKKDICPIEAEATRKNHRHPIGVVKARRKLVGMTIPVAVASVSKASTF